MKIGITLPVYHANDLHADFTKQTIESILSEAHEIHVYMVVNYAVTEYYPKVEDYYRHESIKSFKILDNPLGNHVGGAWNCGIKEALKDECEYAMVPNNDIIFHPRAIDNLVKFAEAHPKFILWTGSEWANPRTIKDIPEEMMLDVFDEHPHFSWFMVNQKTADTIGWFDEKMKMAYLEDGDYHYRILLSENKAAKSNAAKFYHYGSRTIKVDEELNTKNRHSYEDNRAYILKKWGIDFHQKVYNPPEDILKDGFKHPFKDKSKTLKDW